ncbi:MAG TPA: outer membrane lipoprotein carrier protein LolA [Paludibacteraceae bacterium]|nr:outer membrane lipoprotein carrier protein LolA [Paludibacteraceae bacterium]
MNKTLLVACFILLAGTVGAQTNDLKAKAIVDKSISQLFRTPSKFEFTSTYIAGSTNAKEVQKGSCVINGKKAYISLAGMETFFDGKTQWFYVKANNEVSISEPTIEEQKEMNPLMLIRDYDKTHQVTFDETVNDPMVWYLFLYPTQAKKVDYFRIQLSIDKNTKLLKKIEFSQRNADKLIFTIQKQEPYNDTNIFTFNKSNYPKVEMNDLR